MVQNGVAGNFAEEVLKLWILGLKRLDQALKTLYQVLDFEIQIA